MNKLANEVNVLKIKTEIEVSKELQEKMGKFFFEECINQEDWYKKALLTGVENLLSRWERLEARRTAHIKQKKS
jgi:hypothetical protein